MVCIKEKNDNVYHTINAMLWSEVNSNANRHKHIIMNNDRKKLFHHHQCSIDSCVHCMRSGSTVQVIKNEDMENYLNEKRLEQNNETKKQQGLVFFTCGSNDRKRFLVKDYFVQDY